MLGQLEDGWDDSDCDQEYDRTHLPNRSLVKDKPLSILTSTKHSLQPDMLFGWKPKLPSCPLPLKFPNFQNSKILTLIAKSQFYKIAYKNKHFVSSIEINQKYNYHWKYRSRYSLNLALIQEAAKEQQNSNILGQFSSDIKQQPCEYEFSSTFQSGNLDFSVRIRPNEYDCFLRSDSNTKGHCNWYYFSVKNKSRLGQIKINICNISKIKNLYNKGMRPYVRVTDLKGQRSQVKQLWTQQLCQDVVFVERICRYGSEKKRFELQFKYEFSKPNQEVFFAYGIPYTYSRLQKLLKEISCEENKDIITIQKLCESLGGLNVPLLKITKNTVQKTPIEPVKKAVLISARIHPGQSHSSHVMEGLIRHLLRKDQDSSILRQMFVFYIVPMINVDGVVAGNYRTSYSGKDLNRQFKNLDIYIFPEITKLHELALELRQKHLKGIQFYFDFHGHSSKKNFFAYGPDHSPKSIYFFKSRIFPRFIQDFHQIFNYKKSIFRISQGKKKTARAHMLWNLKIPMVYTFQVSNGMYESKNKQNILLNEKILLQAGEAVVKGFFKYVKLEMKIPAKFFQKQASKQNSKKRIINSSKGIREFTVMKRKKSSKNLTQNQEFVSQKSVVGSKARFYSRKQQRKASEDQNKANSINQQISEQNSENFEEFIHLVEEIKRIQMDDEKEGGSDSESDDEDFSKEETDQLFEGIKNSTALKKLKNSCNKTKSQCKSKQKKGIKEESHNIITEIKQYLKKYKNNELELLIKQTKKLNNQMSSTSLPSNKQKLAKYSSASDNKLSKVGTKLYNIAAVARETSHDEKVLKAPLTQKSYNLQIWQNNQRLRP